MAKKTKSVDVVGKTELDDLNLQIRYQDHALTDENGDPISERVLTCSIHVETNDGGLGEQTSFRCHDPHAEKVQDSALTEEELVTFTGLAEKQWNYGCQKKLKFA